MTIQRIEARTADLGEGLTIRRAVPTRERRMVGAWCFLDHIGPRDFETGHGMHVGAHPHIGLQTFTWMIEGEVLHRDSLGHEQVIRPGQVNLMTAGRGIVHTEDSLPAETRLHAAQLWIALPFEEREREPAFEHYPDLPRWEEGSCVFTLLAGRHGEHVAPARLYSPLVGLDVSSTAGGRILLLGGEPFGEPVLMWWNFVGFSKDEIAAAQRAWESGDARFGPVAGPGERRLVAPPLPWPGY